MPATSTPDPRLIAKTHAAMFDLWFPLDELPLPPDAKPEIAAIAAKVNAGMFEGFSNTLVMAILTAMTYPDSL
jgi:hypothetical protein